MLDKAVLEKLKSQLQELERLLANLEDVEGADTVELDQSRMGRLTRMDALQGQAMSEEMGRRRHEELGKVRVALERINLDEYGECQTCGELIMMKRLQLDPAATLCIQCATAAEQ